MAQKNKMCFYYLFLIYNEVTETLEEIKAEIHMKHC